TGKAYVTGNYPARLSVVDATGAVLATIGLPGAPAEASYVAVNSVTNTIYVTNFAYDQVWVIDGATNAVTGTIALEEGAAPRGIAVNPNTNKIYVANTFYDNGQGYTSILDGATNMVVGSLPPTGADP